MRWFRFAGSPALYSSFSYKVHTVGFLEASSEIERWVSLTYHPRLRRTDQEADLLDAHEGQSFWNGDHRAVMRRDLQEDEARARMRTAPWKVHWLERELPGRTHPWFVREFQLLNAGLVLVGCEGLDNMGQPEPRAGFCGPEVTEDVSMTLASLATRPWTRR